MLDKLKKLFQKKPKPKVQEPTKKEYKPRAPKEEVKLTPKELATKNGEPYVNIISIELDPNNIGSGSFELDWNDKFIINLIKAGYKKKESDTDDIIVDRWMQTVARNIALEVYDQEWADPDKRDIMRGMADMRNIQTKDLGNGRTEVS
jgi:hypothetical protein